jgi:hypothetical protein
MSLVVSLSLLELDDDDGPEGIVAADGDTATKELSEELPTDSPALSESDKPDGMIAADGEIAIKTLSELTPDSAALGGDGSTFERSTETGAKPSSEDDEDDSPAPGDNLGGIFASEGETAAKAMSELIPDSAALGGDGSTLERSTETRANPSSSDDEDDAASDSAADECAKLRSSETEDDEDDGGDEEEGENTEEQTGEEDDEEEDIDAVNRCQRSSSHRKNFLRGTPERTHAETGRKWWEKNVKQ